MARGVQKRLCCSVPAAHMRTVPGLPQDCGHRATWAPCWQGDAPFLEFVCTSPFMAALIIIDNRLKMSSLCLSSERWLSPGHPTRPSTPVGRNVGLCTEEALGVCVTWKAPVHTVPWAAQHREWPAASQWGLGLGVAGRLL